MRKQEVTLPETFYIETLIRFILSCNNVLLLLPNFQSKNLVIAPRELPMPHSKHETCFYFVITCKLNPLA